MPVGQGAVGLLRSASPVVARTPAVTMRAASRARSPRREAVGAEPLGDREDHLAVRDGGEQRLVEPKGPARQPLGVAAGTELCGSCRRELPPHLAKAERSVLGGLRGLRPSAPPEPVNPSSRARNHRRSGSTHLIGGRLRDKSRRDGRPRPESARARNLRRRLSPSAETNCPPRRSPNILRMAALSCCRRRSSRRFCSA